MTPRNDTTAILNSEMVPTQSIKHRYQIASDQPLGSGGMSVVHLGWDTVGERHVALRTLREEFLDDQASRARFRREMRTMALMQHPNIARVYDMYEDDSSLWAAIEYVPGSTLRQILEDKGRFTLEEAEDVMIPLCDAVGSLHDRGIVHLDIKPQNIIIDDFGTLKLVDFGLAQPSGQPQELLNGVAYGTAAYLSPEQASGTAVAPASDVYSIGCVLYEMLAGMPPHQSKHPNSGSDEILAAHIHHEPPPPSKFESQLPAWLDNLMYWSLDKDPAIRIADPRQLSAMLDSGIEGDLDDRMVNTLRRNQERMLTDYEPAVPPSVAARPASQSRGRSIPSKLSRAISICVAGLLLALVGFYLVDGTVPFLYDGYRELQAGGIATVSIQDLNLRSGPGIEQPVIATLEQGADVDVSGDVITLSTESWVPVNARTSNGDQFGYLWAEGLVAEPMTGFDRLSEGIVNAFNSFRDTVRS